MPLTRKPDRVASTEHFTFAVSFSAYYIVLRLDTLGREAERIFEHVSNRLPKTPPRRISVVLTQRANTPCPFRGEAGSGRIIVYVDPSTSLDEVFGILAHELGHVLTMEAWGHSLGDGGLIEGTASWAAGTYWSAWHGVSSFEEAVRDMQRNGTYLPLHDINTAALKYEAKRSGRCVEWRDVLYTEWASFIGYLIQKYGWDKFNQVVAYSSRPHYLKNGGRKLARFYFEDVYNKSFEDAETEWLNWVAAQP